MLFETQKAPSVSDLVNHIKHTLEDTFNEVMVEGEISGISHAHSGHCYFSIMDESASISCALFRQDLLRHPGFKNIKEGDKVLIYGPVTVYSKRGTFQIQVKRVTPVGQGLLMMKFEALKKKLSAEGLFDPSLKKKIPSFPKKIAVITAPGGAALQDFLNVYERRAVQYEIFVLPVLVQGEKSPASILKALKLAAKYGEFDVIVLTRGGGSPEDLWCFNDEALIRAIAEMSIPVISAVGHEVDWTLCDYVADLRCETPTAAAETLTQPQTELKRRLGLVRERLTNYLKTQRAQIQLQITRYHPRQLIAILSDKVSKQKERLELLNPIHKSHQYLPLAERMLELDELVRRLEFSSQQKTMNLTRRLDQAQVKLFALNPRDVLSRGYGIISTREGIITSRKKWDSLKEKTSLEIEFADGKGQAIKMTGENL